MKKYSFNLPGLLFLLGLVSVVSLSLVTCKYPNDPAKGNTVPDTRLANVPANDTLAVYINQNAFPEIQLSWIGDDPDGYIVGYRYRWTDFINGQPTNVTPWATILNLTRSGWENVIEVRGTPASIFNIYNFLATLGPTDTALVRIIGDSLFTQRTFIVPYKTGPVPTDSIRGTSRIVLQTPTTGTFIFNSPVDSNLHRFEVAAIDNNDEVDPSPALTNFWTLVSPSAVVLIDAVPPANSLVIRNATERFPGLRFQFRSLDPNNLFDIRFSWAVDDTTNWSPWQEENFAYVTASSFVPIQSGTHRFYVRARNRWGVVSAPRDTAFTAVVPDFDSPGYQQRILIINGVPHTNSAVSTTALDSNRVKAFYSELLDSAGKAGRYDFYNLSTTPSTGRFPDDVIFGRYSLVVYAVDVRIPILGGAFYQVNTTRLAYISRYMLVGGKVIVSGIPDARQAMSNYDVFMPNFMHVAPTTFIPYMLNTAPDFKGGKGRLGYPNVDLDTSKVPPGQLGLSNINLSFPWGFGQDIYRFDSVTDDPTFENLPVGVRYQAPPAPPEQETFSTVYFGFPLYFGQKSQAIAAIRKAILDVNE